MTFEGKGFFIWRIVRAEGGSAAAIASLAQAANYTHVLVKVADGTSAYNIDPVTGIDLCPPVIQALKQRGIHAGGWTYVYGDDPVGEANIVIRRVRELGLDSMIIDVEAPYKEPGKAEAARTFMSALRASLPSFPLALSSYRFPSLHPQIPWREFLEKVDYNMPQVYWLGSHNPGEQLIRSLSEFEALTPFRPLIPTGSAFTEDGWSPTTTDVIEFMQTAQILNLQGANFYEWANCRQFLPEVWDTIAAYDWGALPEPDIAVRYIDALNSHDPDLVTRLYTPLGVHVTASRTIQGEAAIRNWYASLFGQILPNAVFTLASFSGTGAQRFLNWTAISPAGQVTNGSDTLGLSPDNKIAYHYSFFTVI